MTWTQRLILEGGYPDGLWACAGCKANFTHDAEGNGTYIVHPDGCPEVRGEDAPRRDDLALIAYREQARYLLASGIVPEPYDQLPEGTRDMLAAVAEAVARAERERIREAVEGLSAVLTRPGLGYGRAHWESVRVVPADGLLELLGES
jgi:hypothetical protein